MPAFPTSARRPARHRGTALLAAIALLFAAACGKSSDPIVFGAAGPLKESYGQSARNGIQLAIDEANEKGGVNGRRVEVEFKDDSGNGTAASRIAGAFVRDPRIVGVIGHVTSTPMVAATQVYDAGHLAAIGTSVTTPELSGASKWVFRVMPNDSVNGGTLARFASSQGAKRALIIYENDSYGRGLAQGFERAFTGSVIAKEPISGDDPRVDAPLAAYAKDNPDVVVGIGTEKSGLAIMRAGRKLGLKAMYIGGDGWTQIGQDTATAAGAYVGIAFTAHDNRPEAQRFVTAFRAKFHGDPDGDAALGYDAARAMLEAARRAGSDRAGIREALASLGKGTPLEGASGPVAFQSSGDPAEKSLEITRVEHGTLMPVGH